MIDLSVPLAQLGQLGGSESPGHLANIATPNGGEQERPAALRILEQHALCRLGGSPLAAQQIRAWCEDKRVLAVVAGRTPREVVKLSELLAGAACGEFDLAEALWRFRVGEGQARRWFDEHPASERRAAMVAVAALNGAPCQHVLDAQFMLLRLIEPDTTGLASRRPPAFEPLCCEWIDDCCAHIIGGEQRDLGQGGLECVELNSPALRDEVLSYVWQECVQLQRALLSWLCYLGGSDDQLVRSRAAEVAAAFARFDLEQVYREVLAIWAAHELPEVRFAAALALAFLASDADHDWSALRLTQDLAGNATSLCKLAVAAYGGGVGVRFPDQALVDLAALALRARTDPPELLDEIFRSVVNLFERNCAGQVLAALSQWVAVPYPDPLAKLGARIFLTILDMGADAPGAAAQPQPHWLAHTLLSHRNQVAEIWMQLLSASWARLAALDALHRFIVRADTQPQIYTAIEGVACALFACGTARERERLLFCLRQWAHPPAPQHASQAADTILAAVAQIV